MRKCVVFTRRSPDLHYWDYRSPTPDTNARTRAAACRQERGCGFAAAGGAPPYQSASEKGPLSASKQGSDALSVQNPCGRPFGLKASVEMPGVGIRQFVRTVMNVLCNAQCGQFSGVHRK